MRNENEKKEGIKRLDSSFKNFMLDGRIHLKKSLACTIPIKRIKDSTGKVKLYIDLE